MQIRPILERHAPHSTFRRCRALLDFARQIPMAHVVCVGYVGRSGFPLKRTAGKGRARAGLRLRFALLRARALSCFAPGQRGGRRKPPVLGYSRGAAYSHTPGIPLHPPRPQEAQCRGSAALRRSDCEARRPLVIAIKAGHWPSTPWCTSLNGLECNKAPGHCHPRPQMEASGSIQTP